MFKNIKSNEGAYGFIPSRDRWKIYNRIFWPVVLGSTLFALNGFVDNFMVGRYNGLPALFAANSWSSILTGFFVGTQAAGAVAFAQYYFKGDAKMAQSIAKVRYMSTFIMAVLFAIVALCIPEQMIKVFLAEPGKEATLADIQQYNDYLRMGVEYLRVITIQWILISMTFNLGSMFRESGRAKLPFYWGFGSISINVILNATLMYGFDVGVQGAAWATAGARLFVLIFATSYIRVKKLDIGFNPLTIFKAPLKAWKLVYRRWYVIAAFTTTFMFIISRNIFYENAYPTGSIALGLGAAGVLGITNAFTNIFTTSFSALTTMAANFVAPHLAKDEFDIAKKRARELKFFNSTNALFMGIALAILVAFMPYYTFLVTESDTLDTTAQLKNARLSSLVIAFFYPMWIYFSSSYRIALSGGKAKAFTLIDWSFNIVQLGWLALIIYGFKANNLDFYQFYMIFFISDIGKMIVFEITYAKSDWAGNVTKEN